MLRTMLTGTALSMLAAPAFAMGHAGTTGYALGGDGTTLTVMSDISDLAMQSTVTLDAPVSAIAYRPVTGDLLGFAAGNVYVIDVESGALTDTGAAFADDVMMGDGAAVGFDFNNAIDAVRAVTSEGANFVYFPEGFGDGDERANSVMRFTDLAYAAGDSSEGATPNIFANAYTNAIDGATAETTAQYAIDATANALVTLANNEGTLGSVGLLTVDGATVDVTPMGGFDIVSPEEGTDLAYALLQLDGEETAGLYLVDLGSGALTPLGDVGAGGFIGFAATDGM